MSDRAVGEMVKWYRCKVSKEDLAALNTRSDFWGFLQTAGYLGLLATTGTAAYYSASHWPWYVTVLLVYCHGAFWHFMINGFHELIHDSVFKTRALNKFFLWIYSFLGHYSHIAFWASHTEHHKYTLHPPDDLEVTLPQHVSLKGLWKWGIVNVKGPWWFIKGHARVAAGRLEGQWEKHLFEDNPKAYRNLKNWARFLLFGHVAIAATAIYFQNWMFLLLFTCAPWYGGLLHFFCNASQHVGLCDNVPDFRLCCRTIYLNPFFQFLYWHMNYHTEHHMFAAVPCYNLPKLHRLIKAEMPHCPNGLYETWSVIMAIVEKQKTDPKYQFRAEIPTGPLANKLAAPTPAPVAVSDPAEATPVLN